jgi:hypothetical protein
VGCRFGLASLSEKQFPSHAAKRFFLSVASLNRLASPSRRDSASRATQHPASALNDCPWQLPAAFGFLAESIGIECRNFRLTGFTGSAEHFLLNLICKTTEMDLPADRTTPASRSL